VPAVLPGGYPLDAVLLRPKSGLNPGLQPQPLTRVFSRDEESGAKAFRCLGRREPAREHKKLRATLPMHKLCTEPSGVPVVHFLSDQRWPLLRVSAARAGAVHRTKAQFR
jgi:hypothetical protein